MAVCTKQTSVSSQSAVLLAESKTDIILSHLAHALPLYTAYSLLN